MLQKFINEIDPAESEQIIRKLVQHYSEKYNQSGSSLAFHHMAEIAERLKSGDSPEEIAGKIAG